MHSLSHVDGNFIDIIHEIVLIEFLPCARPPVGRGDTERHICSP